MQRAKLIAPKPIKKCSKGKAYKLKSTDGLRGLAQDNNNENKENIRPHYQMSEYVLPESKKNSLSKFVNDSNVSYEEFERGIKEKMDNEAAQEEILSILTECVSVSDITKPSMSPLIRKENYVLTSSINSDTLDWESIQ